MAYTSEMKSHSTGPVQEIRTTPGGQYPASLPPSVPVCQLLCTTRLELHLHTDREQQFKAEHILELDSVSGQLITICEEVICFRFTDGK